MKVVEHPKYAQIKNLYLYSSTKLTWYNFDKYDVYSATIDGETIFIKENDPVSFTNDIVLELHEFAALQLGG